jgi:hypothetical protein
MRVILLVLLIMIAVQAYSRYKEDIVICGRAVGDARYPVDSVAFNKHFATTRYPQKSRHSGVIGTVLIQCYRHIRQYPRCPNDERYKQLNKQRGFGPGIYSGIMDPCPQRQESKSI